MSNEINIKVTGTNASGPTFASVRADMDSLGNSSTKVSDKLNKQQHETVTLEHELKSLADEAKLLGLSFDNVGTTTDKTTTKTTRLRDELGRFKKDSETVTKDVGKSFAGMFTGGGKGFGSFVKDAADAGKMAGDAIATAAKGALDGSGIAEKLMSLLSNPVTGPAVGGIALAITPMILSAVGGAIQLAAAGPFLAAGLMIAAGDQRVAIALGGLKANIISSLKDATAPFRQELIATTGILQNGFDAVLPGIKDTFAALAPAVQPLAKALVSLAAGALPGIEEAAKGLGPVFKELSQDAPMLAKAVGDFFHDVAGQGNSAAASFHLIFLMVGAVIEALGIAIKYAGLLFDMQMHPKNILKDIAAFTDLQAATAATGRSLSDTADSSDQYMQAAAGASGTTTDFSVTVWSAADALKALNDQFATSISNTLAMHDAAAALTLDMADLKKNFKAGKDALDENSVSGAKNIEMIDGIIGRLESKRQADIDAAGGTQAATDKANAAYNSQLGKLGDLLVKLGASRKAVDAFLGAFVNKDVTVSVHIKVTQTGGVTSQGVISSGIPLHGAYAHGGVSRAASGGMRSGMTWVGEAGPELMDLSGVAGAQIYTTGDSKRIASGGGGFGNNSMGATPQTFRFLIDNIGTSEFARLMAQLLKDYVLIQGGDGSVLGIK